MGLARRSQFHEILEGIIGAPLAEHVYFQPGSDDTMQYPCIVYERDNDSVKHADNIPYRMTQRYQVTYIDTDPDSDVVDKLRALPLSAFNRHFTTSGLNHDVFVIYY